MAPMPIIDTAVVACLANRDQLVAFAAMVLTCDAAVREARMGYGFPGGTSHATATGVAKDTGLSVTAARQALCALEGAGLATSNSQGDAWRPDTEALALLARQP
jgi:hypothetical protein